MLFILFVGIYTPPSFAKAFGIEICDILLNKNTDLIFFVDFSFKAFLLKENDRLLGLLKANLIKKKALKKFKIYFLSRSFFSFFFTTKQNCLSECTYLYNILISNNRRFSMYFIIKSFSNIMKDIHFH